MNAPPARLVTEVVRRALEEDIGRGDLTTQAVLSPGEGRARGTVLAREPLVLCGLPFAVAAFRELDPEAHIQELAAEGLAVPAGHPVLRVDATAGALLSAERTALNFLQHLSGIATQVRGYAERVRDLPVLLLDTRKTLPGLRIAEKYAVRVGGGANHRHGLDDGVLLKNNHIALAGSVRTALARSAAGIAGLRPIEVEVRSIDELREALATGIPSVVLLDNFTPADVRRAVEIGAGAVRFEVSGGLRLENLREYAEALGPAGGYLSVGRLTHSAPAVDISFRVERLP